MDVTALAISLLSILPIHDTTILDRVEVIERNSFYDDNGRLIFVQIICWDDGHVRWWTLDKDDKKLRLQQLTHGARITFDDNGVLREIRSPTFHESWDQFDKEVLDREQVPKEARRPLSQRKCTP